MLKGGGGAIRNPKKNPVIYRHIKEILKDPGIDLFSALVASSIPVTGKYTT